MNGTTSALKIRKPNVFIQIWRHRTLMLMFLPGFAFILLFNYGPIYGVQIAFKDFNISKGIWGSDWVGLKHFISFFTVPDNLRLLKNTVIISVLKLVFSFPAPIILAIMINEIGNRSFKRVVQTISYLPHFISWVIIAGIVTAVLSPSTGVINIIMKALGGRPIYFMTNSTWFRPVLVITNIWKEIGWSSVIYLAALSGVDPQLYEAAMIDGSSRMQRVRHITLPSILSVVAIILILSMANILNAGFDQVFNMYNPSVYGVSDIIDTYVYRVGIGQMQFSFTTAMGLFKSLVGLVMVVIVNAATAGMGQSEYGLFH
jgi:putative aldouronate transport system permease protein